MTWGSGTVFGLIIQLKQNSSLKTEKRHMHQINKQSTCWNGSRRKRLFGFSDLGSTISWIIQVCTSRKQRSIHSAIELIPQTRKTFLSYIPLLSGGKVGAAKMQNLKMYFFSWELTSTNILAIAWQRIGSGGVCRGQCRKVSEVQKGRQGELLSECSQQFCERFHSPLREFGEPGLSGANGTAKRGWC